MKTLRKSQSGFGLTGIIAVVLVVAVVAVAGILVVYHRHNNQNNSAPSTKLGSKSETSSNASTDQQAQQYLVIKEWGVQLVLDSKISSLYYYISPDTPDVAYLSLKTVSDIAPQCAADKTSLAAIGKITEQEQANATKNPNALNTPGTIHIGDYWYSFGTSKAACANDEQNQAIEKVQPSYNLQDVFETLEAVPGN